MKILIIGGYGVFGGRLVQLLADQHRLTIFVAGRTLKKAATFVKNHESRAELIPTQFDRSSNVEKQIQALAPDLIVDATGPFQNYGKDPHKVVRAAIENATNYMDLADGTTFVDAVTQFDSAAHANGVFVLSGVSSFPVLTAAVVRNLSKDLARIDNITAGIAPSPFAGYSESVIRAITSYAGKPVALKRDGNAVTGFGLTETRRYTIRPPGHLPLRNRHFSLVDVPDLIALPRLMPELRSVWMGAGPVPASLHHALNVMAWMVRLKLLPSLAPFAKIFHGVINLIRWGEHRGGMFVEIDGVTKAGKPATRSWHLIAEGDDGPFIPSMATAAIVRKCLDGEVPATGARAAVSELELADYEALFAPRSIFTGQREDNAESARAPLYQRVLGDAFFKLPQPIQEMHRSTATTHAHGRATVERGGNIFAKAVAIVIGFPKAGTDIPVRVTFQSTPQREVWTRTFGAKSFSSIQEEGTRKSQGLVVERFGPIAIGLALVRDKDQLQLIARRWTFLGVPLPLALGPSTNAFEHVENGRFCFDVEISMPLIGRIVHYRGYLKPETPST